MHTRNERPYRPTTISKRTLIFAFAAAEYGSFGVASYIAGSVLPYPIMESLSDGMSPSLRRYPLTAFALLQKAQSHLLTLRFLSGE
jgi:hypothetical protein